MRALRLFLIGLCMGSADLIPGVSGGTVAFIMGIYENLLEGIKSLKFQSMREVKWPFLLPLGCGIACAILTLSRPLYYLLLSFPLLINAFFFGIIGGSTFLCFQKASLKTGYYFLLILSFLLSFFFASNQPPLSLSTGFFSLFIGGAAASSAMLLPGISGCYVLYLLGFYQPVILALGHPFEPASLFILFSLGCGIAFGLIVSSRLISWLLDHYSQIAMSILIGMMAGGMRTLWPFGQKVEFLSMSLVIIGLSLPLLLEFGIKRRRVGEEPQAPKF